MTSEGTGVEEQFHFIAVRDGADCELCICRPAPRAEGRPTSPAATTKILARRILIGENKNFQRGILVPIRGTLVKAGFLSTGNVNIAGTAAPAGNAPASPR